MPSMAGKRIALLRCAAHTLEPATQGVTWLGHASIQYEIYLRSDPMGSLSPRREAPSCAQKRVVPALRPSPIEMVSESGPANTQGRNHSPFLYVLLSAIR